MLLIITSIVFPLTVIVLWYLHYYKYYKYLKLFPGPTAYPIIGNLPIFAKGRDVLPYILLGIKKFGPVYRMMLGIRPVMVISEQKFAEFILTSNQLLTKPREYNLSSSWLGTGLLTGSGEKWRNHRKMLTPAFHFKILEQFVEVFHSASNTLINKLSEKAGEQSVDIYPYVALCTLDIICESTMGVSVHAQEDSNSEYVQSVRDMCELLTRRVISPIKIFDFTYRFTSDYWQEKKILKILRGFSNSVIQKRKKELSKNKSADANENEFGIKRKLAFLDLLLQSTIDGKPLPDEDINDEVNTFLFAGHDTTASAISFLLFCLANHYDVQKNVIAELKIIFGCDRTRLPTYADLQEMKYLEMVIKETLRIYPSVPVFGREIETDIEYDGKIIPKGVALSIWPYCLNRNPDVFPDPEKFDPERFNVDNSLNRNPFSYIPFSAGSRNCIGQKFAMLEMKSTISKVLRNFELYPTNPKHELLLTYQAVLKSKNGICIRFKNRDF